MHPYLSMADPMNVLCKERFLRASNYDCRISRYVDTQDVAIIMPTGPSASKPVTLSSAYLVPPILRMRTTFCHAVWIALFVANADARHSSVSLHLRSDDTEKGYWMVARRLP